MLSIKKIYFTLTLLPVLANTGLGQQFYFDHYDNNSGLVNNDVHVIKQDSKGIMYFGTTIGLSLYNGASFINFSYKNGFNHHRITCIEEMPGDEIVFFPFSNVFYKIRQNRLIMDSLPENVSVKNLFNAGNNQWYACTEKGLYLFNNGKLKKLPLYNNDSLPRINCVTIWQDSLLVVGRGYKSIDIFNRHNWKKLASSADHIYVRSLKTDTHGVLWIACIDYGIQMVKPSSLLEGTIAFSKLPVGFIPFQNTECRAIAEDHSGNIWIGSINKGLLRFNPVSQEITYINARNGLISDAIFSLYCDKEDNIWVGSNKGIQKLVHKDMSGYSSSDGLPADLVLDILPVTENKIATCGYFGMALIEPGKPLQAWDPPLDHDNFMHLANLSGRYYGISSHKLCELGVSSMGLFAKKVIPLSPSFSCIFPIGPDKLLLGGDKSLAIYQDDKLVTLTEEKVDRVVCMQMDHDSILWTGNWTHELRGYRLSANNHSLSATLKYSYDGAPSKSNDIILCIAADTHQRIVYGTVQHGIYVLKRSGDHYEPSFSINRSNGLSDNNIHCLYWHNDTCLLVGTGQGLDKIIFSGNGERYQISNVNRYFNLFSTVYSIQKDEKGIVLLGTETGLIRLPEVDIEDKVNPNPPVIISMISLINVPDSILATDETLRLPAHLNSFTISFASPTFINEKLTRYSYWLKGSSQQNWSLPALSDHVSFSDLPPGHYQFQVRAVTVNGNVSEKMASLDIFIQPPFWKTWWFLFFTTLLVGAVAYYLVRRRIRMIRHEAEMKQQIAETEMMALRAQMNPHFIFNCLNSIDNLIQNNEKEKATEYLARFAQLIRAILENSQRELVSVSKDMEALQLYLKLESFRYDHKFSYRVEVSEELHHGDYKMPPMLIQPFVENAIHHGLLNKITDNGIVSVKGFANNGTIQFIIEDNGIGRKQAEQLNRLNNREHNSLGMNITKDRIGLYNKNTAAASVTVTDLYDENKEPAGTRIDISIHNI